MTLQAPPNVNNFQRLHWTAYAVSLLALIALNISERVTYILPFLGIALLASAIVSYRFSGSSAPVWMLRIALWAAIIAQNMMRPDNMDNSFFDLKFNWLGEFLMAELVLQVWKKRPEGGGRGVVTLFLSGLVFLIACDTSEDGRQLSATLFLSPAYMLFLILAIRHFRAADSASSLAASGRDDTPDSRRAAQMRQRVYVVVVMLALGLGIGIHHTFRHYRSELTYLGTRLLSDRQFLHMNLSTTPHLGKTDNIKGSAERVARIHGDCLDNHWRVMAFSRYIGGAWGPSREVRKFIPLAALEPPKNLTTKIEAPVSLTVTRLIDNTGLLYAPLHTVSLDPLETGELSWSEADGGPILIKAHAPDDYNLIVSNDEAYQGILCTPMTAEDRGKLLQVPGSIDPRVRLLADSIVSNITKPQARAEAIEHFLMTNYHYSLEFDPGTADPISKFLLEHGAAHCEYFASSAVILLRYANIPARYVIGYYAHEKDGSGATVIRQHDAHAWAECWIEGAGWIVIDGTPGPGRPDELAAPIPAWQRALEWVQDTWHRLQEWLAGSNGVKAGSVVGVVAFLALGWQWWKQTRRPTGEKETIFAYSAPFEELAGLSARFASLCQTRGLVCPPQQTWQEYLASPAAAAAAQSSGFDVALAQAFLWSYNTARFGLSPSEEALTELKSQLAYLETLSVPKSPNMQE